MSGYKHPEALVSTDWVAQSLNRTGIRLVEVDVDTTAYERGHIPGAVGWNWQTQLQDNVRRDLIDKAALEQLLGKSGISNETTILLYGDHNNWFAAYAFWQLKYHGHKDVRLIDGGRKKLDRRWIGFYDRSHGSSRGRIPGRVPRASPPDGHFRGGFRHRIRRSGREHRSRILWENTLALAML